MVLITCLAWSDEAKTEQPDEAETEQPDEAKTEQPDEVKTEQPDEAKTEQPDEVKTEQPDEAKTEQLDEAKIEQQHHDKTEAHSTIYDKNLAACLSNLDKKILKKDEKEFRKKISSMIIPDDRRINFLIDHWKIKLTAAVASTIAMWIVKNSKYTERLFASIGIPKDIAKNTANSLSSILEKYPNTIWVLKMCVTVYDIYYRLSMIFQQMDWVDAFRKFRLEDEAKGEQSEALLKELIEKKEGCQKVVAMLEAEYNKVKAALANNTADSKAQQKPSATYDKLSNALAQYKSYQAHLEDAIGAMQHFIAKG